MEFEPKDNLSHEEGVEEYVTATADLILGADGAFSTTRGTLNRHIKYISG